MLVKELIEKLQELPPDVQALEVRYDYDYGYGQTEIEQVVVFNSNRLHKEIVVLTYDIDPYIPDKYGYVIANG